jgi:hypothetical protein
MSEHEDARTVGYGPVVGRTGGRHRYGLVPKARGTRGTRKRLADLEDAGAGTRGQFPCGRLKLSPGADRALRSPESQRSIGRRTLDSASGAASRQFVGLPRRCRRAYPPKPCTGGTSVRRRLDAQPYAHLPMASPANLGPTLAFVLGSRGHRSVRRRRSGRLASVLGRNGAPGLRPQAEQERAFAESDGLASPCGQRLKWSRWRCTEGRTRACRRRLVGPASGGRRSSLFPPPGARRSQTPRPSRAVWVRFPPPAATTSYRSHELRRQLRSREPVAMN